MTKVPEISVKITAEAHEKLKILKLATNKTQIDLLSLAIEYYLDVTALENYKVKAMEALLHEVAEKEDGQMSIDDFL
ncbi:hypothetical protein [Lactococcus allomyrinae]|uniref:CopG family transcriptional regulator n=1 Tax=Lactococcus allomyrinae TaxID=2419773 RepID=A0A387BBB3_9LACT|nr:hypothetical protein [Lactococcus allomyrinae]AYG01165.1 hypothetical protein D7I46_08680 [Lactococcus allomyrinae]